MTSGPGRLAVRTVLLCVMALACTGEAAAASRLCRQLQAELASIGSNTAASPARIAKYDSAIDKQRNEIAKARSRANRAGCGFSIFGGGIAACAALNSSIDHMNANLDSLHRQRSSLSKGGTRDERARVVAALKRHGCTGAKPARKPAVTEGIEDTVVERSTVLDDTARSSGTEIIENNYLTPLIDLALDNAPRPQQGEFRTLCVRTCDGYFYPMSNAATLRDFERDQKNCEVSCPGTQMQVFYMRGIGGDPADMTSAASGKPYRELPTAFLYKKPTPVNVPACGCHASPAYQVIGGGSGVSANQESPSIMSFAPPPTARPAPKPTGGEAATALPAPARPLPTDRKIRVVAPAFLPAPEVAKGPQAPAPTPTR